MRLDDLVFVTSNLGKLREAEAVLGVKINHRALDLPVERGGVDHRARVVEVDDLDHGNGRRGVRHGTRSSSRSDVPSRFSPSTPRTTSTLTP